MAGGRARGECGAAGAGGGRRDRKAVGWLTAPARYVGVEAVIHTMVVGLDSNEGSTTCTVVVVEREPQTY